MTPQQQANGKTIKAATSSLTMFACEFTDGTGLVLNALDSSGPALSAAVVPASELPRESDAVCKVDWGWIAGSTINDLNQTTNCAKFQLDKAGLLTISVQVWQGKPFLAFQPYKPAS